MWTDGGSIFTWILDDHGRMDGLASIVSPQVWARIAGTGVARMFAPGEILLFEGDRADRVYVLLSGRVKVSHLEPDGTSLLLAVRGPGEVLGEIGLLGQDGRSATVTAIDRCRTQVITGRRFVALVDELDLREQLLRHSFQRLREAEHLSAQLAGTPARVRVARGLLRLVRPLAETNDVPGADGELDIGLDQREFGQAVGLSRASVAAEFGRLRGEGLVITSRGRIVVADLARLRELAETGE